jgi:hypothetical protein
VAARALACQGLRVASRRVMTRDECSKKCAKGRFCDWRRGWFTLEKTPFPGPL